MTALQRGQQPSSLNTTNFQKLRLAWRHACMRLQHCSQWHFSSLDRIRSTPTNPIRLEVGNHANACPQRNEPDDTTARENGPAGAHAPAPRSRPSLRRSIANKDSRSSPRQQVDLRYTIYGCRSAVALNLSRNNDRNQGRDPRSPGLEHAV